MLLAALSLLAVSEDIAFPALATIVVAVVTTVPATIAASVSVANRRQIEKVRHEVMPNGGSSSFDLLHRLVWETHERTEPIPELVKRVEVLESTPCPYSPKEGSS